MNYQALCISYLLFGLFFLLWGAPDMVGQCLATMFAWLIWPIWVVSAFAGYFSEVIAPRFLGLARGRRRG